MEEKDKKDENVSKLFPRMKKALEIHRAHNHIRNDLDAYLFNLCEWALDEFDDEPKKKDFGL